MPEQDPLLAELQGLTNVEMQYPDGKPQEEPKSDPLEVKAPEQLKSAIQKADAKHSTAAGGQGYRVTVTGEFYEPSEAALGRKVAKPYTIEVNVPSLDNALSVIKNKLLLPMIQRKHPNASGFRTYFIKSAVPLSPATPESRNLAFMPHEKLVEYVEANSVPVDAKAYSKVEDLREAVIDYTLNPNGFEEREARRAADRKETAELEAMNPELAEAANG